MQPTRKPLAASCFAIATLALGAACTPTEHNHGPDGGMDVSTEALTAGETYRVRYTPDPDPIPLNELFDLTLEVEPAAGGALDEAAVVEADAAMPAHGHGMNTAPVVTRQEDGSYLVEGMQFHMPGHWELYVDVEQGGASERATFNVMLEE